MISADAEYTFGVFVVFALIFIIAGIIKAQFDRNNWR